MRCSIRSICRRVERQLADDQLDLQAQVGEVDESLIELGCLPSCQLDRLGPLRLPTAYPGDGGGAGSRRGRTGPSRFRALPAVHQKPYLRQRGSTPVPPVEQGAKLILQFGGSATQLVAPGYQPFECQLGGRRQFEAFKAIIYRRHPSQHPGVDVVGLGVGAVERTQRCRFGSRDPVKGVIHLGAKRRHRRYQPGHCGGIHHNRHLAPGSRLGDSLGQSFGSRLCAAARLDVLTRLPPRSDCGRSLPDRFPAPLACCSISSSLPVDHRHFPRSWSTGKFTRRQPGAK